MSTIATTAQTADSIDYWVRRQLFHYCYGAHPSKAKASANRPWDRRIMLSAIERLVTTGEIPDGVELRPAA